MFTDLSARSCVHRRRRGETSRSVYADDRRGPVVRGAQARAATHRANSIGWWEASHGALRKAKSPITCCKIVGYVSQQLRTIAEFQYSGLSETALFTAGSCLRSAVQGRNPKPPIPGRAKRSSLRQLAVSRILAQSQKNYAQARETWQKAVSRANSTEADRGK